MTQAEPQIKASFVSPLRQISCKALDLLLPPQCLSCGTLIEQGGALCLDCWQAATFIAKPHYAICGLPFESDDPGSLPSD